MGITNRLNATLERWLPEQRLFLKSEKSARYIRLRPLTQLTALGGAALVFGWSIIASSLLIIGTVSEGSSRDTTARAQQAFEIRLAALSAERDTRAAEAAAAQGRFSVALDQVSAMQSQLLTSENQRRELEAGLSAVQNKLHDTTLALHSVKGQPAEDGSPAPIGADRMSELSVALDIVSGELKEAAGARLRAETEATDARREAQEIALDRDRIVARNDALFAQIEDAVSLSTDPMDKMFRRLGLDPDKLLRTVRAGYSGTGGPLEPAGYSTRGDAAITQDDPRVKEILVSLDKVNTYRIAVDKLPLAMPLRSAFRYTSPYGSRWGRRHEGIDMAGPVGTSVFSTADGTVVYAGWMQGYGNLIKIEHELGTETRYGHLSKIRVKVGQKVSRGAQIGDMGNTGRSTGSHLHYEVRVNGQSVDPMSFIKAAQNVF
ncbi:DUF5930 domain-containing protein [Paracoccus aminophilus]|uniref:DUF5930 domain-containing protein n=1 Tax=Paracoccus aminophilus TaxID=34003 RepID=UPI00068886D8|nr:DUF5930 domain-containing protein [Paracoccus aminophilus]